MLYLFLNISPRKPSLLKGQKGNASNKRAAWSAPSRRPYPKVMPDQTFSKAARAGCCSWRLGLPRGGYEVSWVGEARASNSGVAAMSTHGAFLQGLEKHISSRYGTSVSAWESRSATNQESDFDLFSLLRIYSYSFNIVWSNLPHILSCSELNPENHEHRG